MAIKLSDAELLELFTKAQSGDESALGQILDQHRDQLRRFAESELD